MVGGDCTVGIGTVAGLLDDGGSLSLVYFDADPDLNVPGAVVEGALDWMGLAHMLGEEGAAEPLSRCGPRFPMLADGNVLLFAHDPENVTEPERRAIGRRGIRSLPVAEVAADPEGAAARALAELEPRRERLLVHFDVDAVDFTDLPLSEDANRNRGLPFGAAMRSLGTLLGSEKLAALTVTEFNPDHSEEDGSTAETLAEGLACAFSGSTGAGRRSSD